jgi:hypothetical protein
MPGSTSVHENVWMMTGRTDVSALT